MISTVVSDRALFAAEHVTRWKEGRGGRCHVGYA